MIVITNFYNKFNTISTNFSFSLGLDSAIKRVNAVRVLLSITYWLSLFFILSYLCVCKWQLVIASFFLKQKGDTLF